MRSAVAEVMIFFPAERDVAYDEMEVLPDWAVIAMKSFTWEIYIKLRFQNLADVANLKS